MNSALWEILIPRYFNNGVEIPLAFHRGWDKKIATIADGIIIIRTVFGTIREPVHVHCEVGIKRESMIPVRVCVGSEEILQGQLWPKKNILNKILEITAEHYGQKSVMAYVVSDQVVFFYSEYQ